MKSRVRLAVEALEGLLSSELSNIQREMAGGDARRIKALLIRLSERVSREAGVKVIVSLRNFRMRGSLARDLGLIYVERRKRFGEGERDLILKKARELFGDVPITRFLSRERDGLHLNLANGRIDVLAGSVYVWTDIDEKVLNFLEFLEREVYGKYMQQQI